MIVSNCLVVFCFAVMFEQMRKWESWIYRYKLNNIIMDTVSTTTTTSNEVPII